MINAKADATIDVDDKRRIWIESSVEFDPNEVDSTKIIQGMTQSVTEQAVGVYDQLVPRYAPGPAAVATPASDDPARLRGEARETDPLGTFGDDED